MKHLIFSLVSCGMMLAAQAATVDFTAAEGYADGDVNNHADWTGLSANTVSTGAAGYNDATGTVTLDPDTGTRDSVFNLPTAMNTAGDTMTIRSIFRFTSNGDILTSRKDIYTHSYYDAWAASANEVRANLCRKPNAANTYDVRVRGVGHDYSSTFAGTLLGLPPGGIGTTDWLQMTTVLRRGADATVWEMDVELINLASGSPLLNETVNTVESAAAFFSAGTYYPGFNSGSKEVDCLASAREIDRFESTSSSAGANQPPAFSSNPISKPNADIGTAYTNSIAADASDPESDPLTFSKTAGPAWLQVAADGMITGMPLATDTGVNAFTVQVAATGGVDTATLNITVNAPPPDPTGWETFVADYGLTGSRTADADADGQLDITEFYFGGNPTNPAVQAVRPRIAFGTNDTVSFICTETAHTNPGVSAVAEWTDQLVSGIWQPVWDVTNTAPAALPGYNEVARMLNAPAQTNLFFRNRIEGLNRPNILVILCDDLGYCDVGFTAAIFGEKATSTVSPVTPHIDTLATNGLICTQAYVPHPFCGPSRMGLLAGRYPHHFGGSKNMPYETADRPSQQVRDTYGYEPANLLGISTNETTIATVLQNAGYHTGAIGKWHCGVSAPYHPNHRGFDHWYGMLGGGHNYYSDGWLSKTNPAAKNDYQFLLTRNGVEEPAQPGQYLTDLLSDDAVSFITNAPASQPFFLYLCYNAPHAPLQAKTEDLQTLFGINSTTNKQQINTAMMYAVDRGVSNIVSALQSKGMLDNTLIIFFSDNGGKEKPNENDADNGPFKGGKGDTYEGGVRTPMFIHYPNAIGAGGIYSHPIYPYDLYPTFAALGAAPVPAGKVLDGINIWDALLADQDAHPSDTVFWVRHNASANNVSMRNGNYKANRLNNGAWKLYDIVADPYEQTDIVSAHSTVLDAMLADGRLWMTEGVDPLWHDTESGYWKWETNNMPNYATSFSR